MCTLAHLLYPAGTCLSYEKDEFQDRVGWNCCRRHVKSEEATSNTKIVANMPAAAAAATAATTSTFAATVITANIIDQTFTIFFGRREPPLLVTLKKIFMVTPNNHLFPTPITSEDQSL